jgi:beta-glucosidase
MSDSPESETQGPIFDKFENESEEPSSNADADISTTPNTEISPPDSPTTKSAALSKQIDRRTKSRTLAASLSIEEQVRLTCLFVVFKDFWINSDI